MFVANEEYLIGVNRAVRAYLGKHQSKLLEVSADCIGLVEFLDLVNQEEGRELLGDKYNLLIDSTMELPYAIKKEDWGDRAHKFNRLHKLCESVGPVEFKTFVDDVLNEDPKTIALLDAMIEADANGFIPDMPISFSMDKDLRVAVIPDQYYCAATADYAFNSCDATLVVRCGDFDDE